MLLLLMMMLSLALHAVEGLAFLAERGAAPADLFARACLLFAPLAPPPDCPSPNVRTPCLRHFADHRAAVAGSDAQVAPGRAAGEGRGEGGKGEGPADSSRVALADGCDNAVGPVPVGLWRFLERYQVGGGDGRADRLHSVLPQHVTLVVRGLDSAQAGARARAPTSNVDDTALPSPPATQTSIAMAPSAPSAVA